MPAEAMKRIFSEGGLTQKWLDVEAALAKAEGAVGLIPKAAAEEICRKARLEFIDQAMWQASFERTQHPIMPLIETLQAACAGDAGEYVHWGATSQDIMDTGYVLRLKEAYQVIFQNLREVEGYFLELAEKHAETLMAGRTHKIHAVPFTFGYKVAVWVREIRRHIERLKECRERVLVGQLGGAVGTMASFGEKGPQVQALAMKELGLGTPDICWHAARDRSAEFANLLAMIASTLGKIASEVRLLSASEIAELEEPWAMGKVGSSTMPHKRNPTWCEVTGALVKKVRYNAALVTEAMIVEHERDLNFWLAEMEPLAESCIIMGELLFHSKNLAKGLVVNTKRMEKNLDALHGLLVSEAVMLELGRKVGRQTAHEVVYEAAMKAYEEDIHLKQVLMQDPRVSKHLSEAEIDRILDPRGYVGLAPQITREMVALTRKEREKDQDTG